MKSIIKYSLAVILDLIFTVCSIGMLYFTRMQTKLYMDQVTALSPVIDKFTQEAAANNITNVPLQQVIQLESVLDKALIINNWILPITIIILFIATQMLVWKLINKTPIWKFVVFSIVPAIFVLITLTNFMDVIYSLISGDGYSIVLFVILLVVSITLSYTALLLLTNYEKPKDILKIVKKKWKRSILPFILLFISVIIYLVVFAICLIAVIAGYLNVILCLVMIIVIILFNLARYYYIKKVKF